VLKFGGLLSSLKSYLRKTIMRFLLNQILPKAYASIHLLAIAKMARTSSDSARSSYARAKAFSIRTVTMQKTLMKKHAADRNRTRLSWLQPPKTGVVNPK
jgi:hypothetical protein